ncbi:MAG: hypothetical protein JWP64_3800 [Pseudonocardia sp.]|jgi:nitroimidazol reductase NimA-like FMN-containing flavoprotein (pyridoxamine 5'-phosphate oxidase superfamily)|nr:hypothetical protein [Pseudonocardia sp.]MDT7701471.1 hypothetical protein [Pseudonocardiales bacterium]
MPVTLSELAPLDGVKRWAFLEQAKTIRLASARDGEAIHVTPAWYVVKDEAVYIPMDPVIGDPGSTSTPAAKHQQTIEAGGRVSGVVDEGDEIANFRAVQLEGRAEVVDDPALIEELLDLAAEKYFYFGHPHLEYYFSAGAVQARRWYKIVPDRTDGWDTRVLPQPPVAEKRVLPPHILNRA